MMKSADQLALSSLTVKQTQKSQNPDHRPMLRPGVAVAKALSVSDSPKHPSTPSTPSMLMFPPTVLILFRPIPSKCHVHVQSSP